MSLIDRITARMRDAIDGPPQGPGGRPPVAPASLAEKLGLTRVSDEALGAELERRRRARGKPAHRRVCADDELDAMASARRARVRELSLSKAYSSLEVRQGAPRAEVERAFRAMLRQYHPDRHMADAETHQSALALAASLTDSYLAVLRQLDPKY